MKSLQYSCVSFVAYTKSHGFGINLMISYTLWLTCLFYYGNRITFCTITSNFHLEMHIYNSMTL